MNNKTKLQLPTVSLVCADCKNIENAIEVLEICQYYTDFKEVKFFTSSEVDYKHKVLIPHIGSYSDYSRFIFNELDSYINHDGHVMIVQHDGWMLNPDAWTDDFLNYGYIGALLGPAELPEIVGNGGYSLRSKKLLSLCAQVGKSYNDKSIDYSEDLVICYFLRDWFEKQGIKFAPPEVAHKFSVERERKWTRDSTGFHNFSFVNPWDWGWVHPFKPEWKPDLTNYLLSLDHSG